MTQPPLFGAAPSVRDMLAGVRLPYGNSAHHDLYNALAQDWPALLTGDEAALEASVGGSIQMAAVLLQAWLDADAAMAAKGNRKAARTFQAQMYSFWTALGALLDERPGAELFADEGFGVDDPLDALRDRTTLLLAMLGEATALRLLQPMLWHYARLSRPAQAGSDELFYAAVGYEMLHGDYAVRSLPESDLVDCVGQWREHGRSVLTTVLGQPAVKAPAPGPIRRLQEARRRAPVDGPSLRVLASVEHLPGSAKDGGDRPSGSTASTARGEYAPMAGRDMPLVIVPDLARVRRRLVREFPDAAEIIDAILRPLAGRRFAWLSPLLLRGAPGSGKSRLARRLGEELGLAVTVYSCAGVADSSFIGTSRQWSTGRACVPLQAIKRADAASVLIVLDELPRAGTRRDNGRLVDGILALTERETARAFHDPYVECAVDLSAVSYVATANSTDCLDPALLSRFRVFHMPLPTLASLPVLAQGIAEELRRARGLGAVWLPNLTPEELDMVAEHWRGGSVRVLQALVECALDGRQTGPAN